MIDPKRAAAAQKYFCKAKGLPLFAPSDGVCWRCSNNIYKEVERPDGHKTGYSVEIAGSTLITGCPHCCRSYCD